MVWEIFLPGSVPDGEGQTASTCFSRLADLHWKQLPSFNLTARKKELSGLHLVTHIHFQVVHTRRHCVDMYMVK